MTTSGKTLRLAQPAKQVVVDAGLLPKAGNKAAVSAGPAKVNIVAPVAPQVAAMRQKMKQQSVKAAVARVDAAIEAGTVSAADAKKLVLSLAVRRVGSVEAAEKWYRSQHLAVFGGRTPAQMVRAGDLKTLVASMRAEAVEAKG